MAAHGTNSGYKGGCRCADCRGAHAAEQKAYHERRRNDPEYVAKQREYKRRSNAKQPSQAERSRAYDASPRGRDVRSARNSRADLRASVAQHRSVLQSATLPAKRSGAPWTPEDDIAVTRADLTVLEAALLPQRTWLAVSQRRHHLRKLSQKEQS